MPFMRDAWTFFKNPIVLMFFIFFGFIQFIVILAALSSDTQLTPRQFTQKTKANQVTIDWRYKTVFKVELDNESKVDHMLDTNSFIQYGSEDFQYPLLVDMLDLVEKRKENKTISVKPINDPQFKYLIDNTDFCKGYDQTIDLLLLIKSNAPNTKSRDVIRSTWGRESCWGGKLVKRLFLFGRLPPAKQSFLGQIHNESKAYGDILQGDFIDNYYNNTLKLMMGLDWAVRHCGLGLTRTFSFVDDDYMVQPRMAAAYLDSISDALRPRLFAGYVWRAATPQRNRKTKWYVSQADYPWPVYPPYCSAGHFFVSVELARDISIAMKYTKYLRFDDVFLGLVLHKLLIVPIHLSSVFSFNPVTKSSTGYTQMISSHGFRSTRHLMDVWTDLKCHRFCQSTLSSSDLPTLPVLTNVSSS